MKIGEEVYIMPMLATVVVTPAMNGNAPQIPHPINPKKNNWSERNIERAERMIENGLMTEHGLKFIEIAKEKDKWVVT